MEECHEDDYADYAGVPNNKWKEYTKAHEAMADELAKEYDVAEGEEYGTVSHLVREDENLLQIIGAIGGGKGKILMLDGGCGTGRYELVLDGIKSLTIDAVDISKKMLEVAERRVKSKDNIRFIHKNLNDPWDFKDNSFDLVVLGHGVPSYTDYRHVLKETYRVLKLGAICMCTVYNTEGINLRIRKIWKPALAANINPASNTLAVGKHGAIHNKTFTVQEFKKTLEDYGFEVCELYTFPTLCAILPATIVNKRLTKNSDGELYYGLTSLGRTLHKADKIISRLLDGSGAYITINARKLR
jgi:ubiquinone/menaquinone biosynthesis C-methylase UbiE